MAIRSKRVPGAVALLLLALALAPAFRATMAATDAHACCPSGGPAADSPAPCQFVAPLGCCSQAAVTATPTSDAPPAPSLELALPAADPLLPQPPVRSFACARDAHGPPQTAILRTTVLRL